VFFIAGVKFDCVFIYDFGDCGGVGSGEQVKRADSFVIVSGSYKAMGDFYCCFYCHHSLYPWHNSLVKKVDASH
jgi:hypothetical protein